MDGNLMASVHVLLPDGKVGQIDGTCLRCAEFLRTVTLLRSKMDNKLGVERPVVKQYGLQRSGSNYLKLLLEENCDIEVLSNLGGSKHEFYIVPHVLEREVPLVISCKSPVAWLTSMYRHTQRTQGYSKAGSFSSFLRQPLFMPTGFASLRASNPVEHYNNMHAHWLSIKMNSFPKVIVRYEDVLSGAEFEVSRICGILGVKRKESEFWLPERNLGPMGEATGRHIAQRHDLFDASYYTDRRYMDELGSRDLHFIAKTLDPDVLSELGYSVDGWRLVDEF